MPLSANQQFRPFIKQISQKLRKLGISARVDDSRSVMGWHNEAIGGCAPSERNKGVQ